MTTGGPPADPNAPALPRSATGIRPPWFATYAPAAALAWGLGYGTLRAYWTVTDSRPNFPPFGADLLSFSGWGIVGLCAATVAVTGLLAWLVGPRVTPPAAGAHRLLAWGLVAVAWCVAAGIVAAACLVLLDAIGLLLLGAGMPLYPGPILSRAGCLVGGLAMGATALAYQRRLRDGCASCGRRHDSRPLAAGQQGVSTWCAGRAAPPWWAWTGAYLAVAGCVVRFAAQAALGFGGLLDDSNGTVTVVSGLAFLVGVALAGTVLPLALVHRWGLIWPRWTLVLSGRRVPRWLVLGPALVVSVGMTAYFGTGLVQVLSDPGQAAGSGEYSLAFLWTAMTAYVLWGVGLGIAALSYLDQTRPACRWCGAEASG
ncbi:hypothetical protein [Actinopolymorpha alba]|uniref:hypothetical protein n=1 Tax=Actinopolymorpha alba TaxID=533267 RepID=UPI00037ECC8A|nr:hypothetical protein [Actinopolymorpha alba]